MDRVKDIFSYFLIAMAMFSLLCAIYEAMNQRFGSATALLALFLSATCMFYFPQLETFKAAGVEVRLRQTLDRAEEIIERLKQLSIANAKVTYMTIAWGNRMGSPSAADKQAILDQTDGELRALRVDEAERHQIARPLVQLIGVDIYHVYSQTIWRFVQGRERQATAQLNASHTPEAVAAHQTFSNAVNDWRKANAGVGPYSELDRYDLRAHLARETPLALMNEAQQTAATDLAKRLAALYDACVMKGGYTKEAAEFLDKHRELGDFNRLSRETFGLAYD